LLDSQHLLDRYLKDWKPKCPLAPLKSNLIFFQSTTEVKQPNHPVLDEEEMNKSDQSDEHRADQTDRVEKRKMSGEKDVYVISTNRPLPDACYIID
jgi:hypothetical protein